MNISLDNRLQQEFLSRWQTVYLLRIRGGEKRVGSVPKVQANTYTAHNYTGEQVVRHLPGRERVENPRPTPHIVTGGDAFETHKKHDNIPSEETRLLFPILAGLIVVVVGYFFCEAI
jgi:hypothetical protein